ncbi:alpha/beta fold hydrolase [Erwinia persicina]|uniref:alpha/beta fold hydrolase n=1 Tax=Erwinia persicina TaxID=55211 RepID=UPI00177E512E|nr:alpha/beta hydrolase [Erwinia persicina]MBD8163186.1 alpha/beta hydrolase [Erwinia persicina]MBD8214077.1 alpha/beta hydrolase [Erwinia persicina]
MKLTLSLVPVCCSLLLAGCMAENRVATADAIARQADLKPADIPAGPFVLRGWKRIYDPHQPVHLYIEGDGFAWVTPGQPSRDPTPLNPVALKLAAADNAVNVAYLARPCQYVPMGRNPACNQSWWTDRRFAPAAVAAMNNAISQVMRSAPGQPLILVGYSGGGAIAALVAARRSDVQSLRTVAGNLDMDEVNRLHHASPMPLSLNAKSVAPALAGLPQIHYSGSADRIILQRVTEGYVSASHSPCVKWISVPGMTHGGDWDRLWPTLLMQPPDCE